MEQIGKFKLFKIFALNIIEKLKISAKVNFYLNHRNTSVLDAYSYNAKVRAIAKTL